MYFFVSYLQFWLVVFWGFHDFQKVCIRAQNRKASKSFWLFYPQKTMFTPLRELSGLGKRLEKV